jgi:chromosome segregation ATPase
MRRRELFRRMDAHMERGDQLMVRIDGHMERGNVLMGENKELMVDIREEIDLTRRAVDRMSHEVELTREEVRLSRQSRDDLRGFIRDMVTRMNRRDDAIFSELRDLREESRAQRHALLRMIDRMDGLDPGSASAG